MPGLLSAYDLALLLAVVVACGAVVAAVAGGLRARRRGGGAPDVAAAAGRWSWPWLLGIVLVGTAVPREWPLRAARGDLALRIGDGGLDHLPATLRAPDSLPAVEFAGNLGMYAALGLAAALATTAAGRVLLACSALSAAIEVWQYLAVDRVAATDDWLLNTLGAAVGVAAAVGVRRVLSGRSAPAPG